MNTPINQLLQGDCLHLMSSIPSQSVDMILCDLPYGSTHNPWDCPIPLNLLWPEYLRIIKTNGAMVFTAQNLFTAELILSNPKYYRYKWIWVKSKPTNFLNAKRQPLRKHEDICVFYKKPPTYHPQMYYGQPYNKGRRKGQPSTSYNPFEPTVVASESGLRYPTDVIYFPTAESEGPVFHPAQKPVGLGRYLVRTYTEPGAVILDNAFGSGSFLVAAVLEGRNFIGIEKEGEYVAVAERRLKEAYESLSMEYKKRKTPLL